MKRETQAWFLIYVLSALLVLGIFLNLALHYGPGVERWLMERLVPEAWYSTVEDLRYRWLRDEMRGFFVTTGFGLGIVLIGMTLFPIKEKLSSCYEVERFPEIENFLPPPLWQQGWEEVQLAFLYLLMQGFSFFLLLQGHPALAAAGQGLAIFYLVVAMALDHAAQFFQRRGRKLPDILWIYLRKAPLRFLGLGVCFIGPVIVLERVLPSEMSATVAISILVFTEVLGMAFATLAGCRLGGNLTMAEPRLATSSAPGTFRVGYHLAVGAVAVWLGVFFGWWGRGLVTHADFVKSEFRPQWGEASFRVRERRVIVDLPVAVRNRGKSAIDATDLKLVVLGTGVLDGEVRLSGPVIEAAERGILTLRFEIEVSEEALLDLPKFLDNEYSAHFRFDPPLSRPVLVKIFPR